MSDSDYGDFAEFTAEDFEEIDAAILAALGSQSPTRPATPTSTDTSKYWDSSFSFGDLAGLPGGPDILIELEGRTADVHGLLKDPVAVESDSESSGPDPEPGSPYNRFRRKNVLSVSDLVGPAWCEVQFDYGLRQRRSFKLESRPTTFVSAHGREIKVNPDVARKNDKVLKAGQSVHKVLEREVKPAEVEIYITTEEERWALRLVNMLAAVGSLMTVGFAREIPVFGIVNNQIIVGIIDELRRELKPQTPPPSVRKASPYRKPALGKRLKRTQEVDESHAKITSFFKGSDRARTPSPKRPPPSLVPLPRYILHLSDSKTRRTMTLPSEDDALPSRLQLMLYHRLLSKLVSLSKPFDFSRIWKQLRLRPDARLGHQFLTDAGLLLGADWGAPLVCLNDLTAAWLAAVERLDVDSVDKHLKLVYRTRPTTGKVGSKRKRADVLSTRREDVDLATAVEASLKEEADADLQKAIEASLTPEKGSVVGPSRFTGRQLPPHLTWVVQNSLLQSSKGDDRSAKGRSIASGLDIESGMPAENEVNEAAEDANSSSEDESPDSHVFGIKYFQVDDALLDDYLKKVLDWWYGRRSPEGVSLDHTSRCFSCEYSDDCEWRAAKAREALAKPAFGGAEERYF